jgi:hypothetical protein
MVGASPNFDVVHKVRAILALSRGPVGRKRLVKILGLGEGSVRTIIKHLSSEGLLESDRLGHTLSAQGERKAAQILGKISAPEEVDLSQVFGGRQAIVIVKNGREKIGNAIGLRDIALKAGADGAIIMFYDGALKFPGKDMKPTKYPEISEPLKELELKNGDAIVVSFAKNLNKAQDGATAAALKMTDIT